MGEPGTGSLSFQPLYMLYPFFKNSYFFTLKVKVREVGRERSCIYWFTLQVAIWVNIRPGHINEPGVLSCSFRGPHSWAIFHTFSQAFITELDQKWSNQDKKESLYRIPALQPEALSTNAAMLAPTLPPDCWACTRLLWKLCEFIS